MAHASKVAKQAAIDIERFLLSNPATVKVQNVEENKEYQTKDIDLIWTWKKEGEEERETSIEIKGDRYHSTGNYFLETVSNKSKATPGCFMYTEADYIFYYFVTVKELHILPMPAAREWFEANIEQFRESETSTPGSYGSYITVGRLVNREKLQKNVSGVKVIKI